MVKASHLLLCVTFIVTGEAAAQTTNDHLNDITTPIGSETMTMDGSESFSPQHPIVTHGDGATTTDDPAGTGDMAGDYVPPSDGGDTVLSDGSFSKLSPGNQKIATALFDAQTVTTGMVGSETTPMSETASTGNWTLDQIAAAKQHTGWGRLLRDMQDAGVIPKDVKNLGQLVSGKYQPSDIPTEPATVTSIDVENAASGDATLPTEGGTQAVDAAARTRAGKAEVTAGATAGVAVKAVKANRGGGNHSDIVITTGSGRQVHVGAANKSKAKTGGAAAAKGGKRHSTAGHRSGSTSSTTVVTTGSGAQAAIGAGRGLGHSKSVTTGAGRSSSGGGHSKSRGVHTGKGSGKIAVTTGRGGGKGFTHHRGGGKGKGKIK